jgi:hypothetical protein
MISFDAIQAIGERLTQRSSNSEHQIYDVRIDSAALASSDDVAMLRHNQHQVLLRAYQSRYVLLPTVTSVGSIVEHLHRHYDSQEIAALERLRPSLEVELIEPWVTIARSAAPSINLTDYIQGLVVEQRTQGQTPFVAYLRECHHHEHHYRNFLIQSSADLLAEASASALGIVGEFGAPQSALFRILIDEFGYGVHERKHSVLYRAVMRDFGLCSEYNAYWPLFDTVTLELHNTIHYLFQNPRNFFMQIGFLLFAETAYQHSTRDHWQYLREFYPKVDARYFAEHAHIDLHHTRIVIDEVIAPLLKTYGGEVGREIMVGAELTKRSFDAAGAHLLAVSRAFDAAVIAKQASYASPDIILLEVASLGSAITPAMAALIDNPQARIQVGGLGWITKAHAFTSFPEGTIGRLTELEE